MNMSVYADLKDLGKDPVDDRFLTYQKAPATATV